MTGKDIVKNDNFSTVYDLIEAEAVKKIDEVFKGEDHEITDEESNKCELIADYKYKAQEYLETSFLYFERLLKV